MNEKILNQCINEPRGFLSDSAMPKNVSVSRTWDRLIAFRIMSVPEARVLTVSRAVAKEEGIFAAAGSETFPGALFCIFSARSAILRRVGVEASAPKETE